VSPVAVNVWPTASGEDVLTGIHHLALTVTDVARSAAWYCELLGMVQVIGDDTDEVRTGMDHVAIGVESAVDLMEWEDRLDELEESMMYMLTAARSFHDLGHLSCMSQRPWEIDATERCVRDLREELEPGVFERALQQDRELALHEIFERAVWPGNAT
jgi:catechol 2,3-dioxygenase-like lactoylglutathione lyase family enzyme